VDLETDKLIQEVIREEFNGATIISVAHRLNTLLDFDRVVVVDKGVVIEDGNPQELLQKKSAFKVLYELHGAERHEDIDEENEEESE
jgi:ABC-type multidrug transport system fused ATPase/permease subunit